MCVSERERGSGEHARTTAPTSMHNALVHEALEQKKDKSVASYRYGTAVKPRIEGFTNSNNHTRPC